MRRGEKVSIDLPVFKDKHTQIPVNGSIPSKPDHVHMDAMGFGMGCCCLQMTFQACSINEARQLYDQLTPLCPIMLAFTAASPIYRGLLTEIDCRFVEVIFFFLISIKFLNMILIFYYTNQNCLITQLIVSGGMLYQQV